MNPLYSTCPYSAVPPSGRWADAVARVEPSRLNPHVPSELRINRSTAIGTAGSCFAQHISRALGQRGFNYLVVEPCPPGLTSEEKSAYGYEVFSARYGNVYTARQMAQLFDRAYGSFQPMDDTWESGDGRWYDLLRPRIQPSGFASEEELHADRARHLKAVRRLFETVDVFIFTLGLTEAWRDRPAGTVYPLCPGCGAGTFAAGRYEFHNFTVAEVVADLDHFLCGLLGVNPKAQVILTVSPVPLIATYEPRHVLQSTVYSKSVLRVAAEETVRRHAHAHYFASYEIITASFATHRYFAEDRRTVTTAGVDHVIDVFLRQYAEIHEMPAPQRRSAPGESATDPACDEAAFFAALTTRSAG